MGDLSGKTALVTGASRGIGRAIARRLAADGARVAVHFNTNAEAAAETVAEIERVGGCAFPVHAELGVDGDVESLFTGLEAELGGVPLNILVNNAASGDLTTLFSGSIRTLSQAQFDRVFAVNVKAPFFIIQRALPLMCDGGRIVNMSSTASRIAVSQQIAYAMTKTALQVMSRTLANELGSRGITVNSVAPGATDSGLNSVLSPPEIRSAITTVTALERIGEPADIADAVAFLVSDDARWITANHLDASGGMYLGPIDRTG